MEAHESSTDHMSFQDCITEILMASEELRQNLNNPTPKKFNSHQNDDDNDDDDDDEVTAEMVLNWRHQMEELMHRLWYTKQQCAIRKDPVEQDMHQHCFTRIRDIAWQVFEKMIDKDEAEQEEEFNEEIERDCQASIARLAEINLLLNESIKDKQEEIISLYVGYQRKVLRQRAKPSIAKLVAIRKQDPAHTLRIQQQQQQRRRAGNSYDGNNDDEDDDDDDDDERDSLQSQHAHVLTVILGQASSLIHPLLLWRSNLPPEPQTPIHQLCLESVCILDEQAQTLTKTVWTWFGEDKKVDEWLAKSAALPEDSDGAAKSVSIDLSELDGLVEEMAFGCQVMARYQALVQPGPKHNDKNNNQSLVSASTTKFPQPHIEKELLPEWTWKYASLERFLGTQQLLSALEMANPVHIVVGTKLQVPSVVEDSQFLSTRALERAASTRSTQAIGTVAHSIASDVWSTEIRTGVHQALIDQRGCWQDDTEKISSSSADKSTPSTKLDAKGKTSFATALMGALDEDLSSANNSNTPPLSSKNNSKPPSAPDSGAFLQSLSFGGGGSDKLQQIRIDTQLCALNGIHSAAVACSSLVKFLDSLLPNNNNNNDNDNNELESKATSMTQLAREELFRYAKEYEYLMQSEIAAIVTEWCGSLQDAPTYKGLSIPVLRFNLERESYDCSDSTSLALLEDDARLEKLLIIPLKESKLLQQLDKCDSMVALAIGERLSEIFVELILECITSQNAIPKRFTDWGALLFSKQVRLLQTFLSNLLQQQTTEDIIPNLSKFEKLSQVATVLQLEKPSDWAFYKSTSVLTNEELQRVLSLRIDFLSDAVAAAVAAANN